MNNRFEDKVIFITGAASGIGRATAMLMAAEKGKIMVSDINETGGQETVQLIRQTGGEAEFIKTDVSSLDSIKNAVAETISRFGKLDIGINNAGIGGGWAPTAEYSHEDWDKVIAINQTGVFYCMQEELKHMMSRKSGNIVNVSSMAGLTALPKTAAYVASKHAVLGLTKTAAQEYARFNIRVNAACPVFTRTPIFNKMLEHNPKMEERLLQRIPLGRYGQPEEVAQAIAWLASDDASLVTGLCMPIDGGLST